MCTDGVQAKVQGNFGGGHIAGASIVRVWHMHTDGWFVNTWFQAACDNAGNSPITCASDAVMACCLRACAACNAHAMRR